MPCSGCIPLSGCGGGRRLRGGDAAPRGIGRESCVGSRSVTRVTLLLLRGKPPLPRAWRGILSLLQHAAAASDSFPSLPSPLGYRTALHPHAEAAFVNIKAAPRMRQRSWLAAQRQWVAEMLARRAAAVAEMPCSGCIPLSGCGGGRRLRGGDAAPRGIGRESCVGSRSVTRVTLLLLRGKPPLPRAWRGILSLLQHAAAASDSFPSLPSPLGCRTALHPHAEAALRPPRPALRPFCWQCFFLIKMHHNSHIILIQTG